MKQGVINSIARDYQHHMSHTTMHMKVVLKLLRLTHISLSQGRGRGRGGSTLQCMILVVKICNTQQCPHHYHVLTLAGFPYRSVGIPLMTIIGGSMVMNVGSQRHKVRLGLQTRLDPMVRLPLPRVYVGIASLGLTPTSLATWRIHNRFEPSRGLRVPRSKDRRTGRKTGYRWVI